MFEVDGLFTPCHSDMQSTEGVKVIVASNTLMYCNMMTIEAYMIHMHACDVTGIQLSCICYLENHYQICNTEISCAR